MGGADPAAEAAAAKLKGWERTFNAITVKGRRNTVFAVYGTLAGVYVVYKMFAGKKEPKAQATS